MTKPLIELPDNIHAPMQIQVNRNGFKESLHEIDIAVCDVDGRVIRALGYPSNELVENFFQPKLKNWAGDEVGDVTTPNFVLDP